MIKANVYGYVDFIIYVDASSLIRLIFSSKKTTLDHLVIQTSFECKERRKKRKEEKVQKSLSLVPIDRNMDT